MSLNLEQQVTLVSTHDVMDDHAWTVALIEVTGREFKTITEQQRWLLRMVYGFAASGRKLPKEQLTETVEEELGLSRGCARERIAQLETWGFIACEPSSVDRRVRYVVPTDKLWKVGEIFAHQRLAVMQWLLRRLESLGPLPNVSPHPNVITGTDLLTELKYAEAAE